jgi:hypothetical protein
VQLQARHQRNEPLARRRPQRTPAIARWDAIAPENAPAAGFVELRDGYVRLPGPSGFKPQLPGAVRIVPKVLVEKLT